MTIPRATYTLCIIPTVAWQTPAEAISASGFALVAALDRLFDRLADRNDPTLQTLLLGGETGLLETYVTVRPERYEQIEGLIQTGVLMIGPWYVQPFGLLGLEALIRNLSIGTRTMQAFGVSTTVAYVSDTNTIPNHLIPVLHGFKIETVILPPNPAAQSDTLEYVQALPDNARLLIVPLRTQALPMETDAAGLADAIDAMRTASAPYSAANVLPIITIAAHPQVSAIDVGVLPEALLMLYDRRHDQARQTTLREYAASIQALRPHLPIVRSAPIAAEQLLLIKILIGSNTALDDLQRLLLDWVEPLCAWAEALPPVPNQPGLRSPQRAIEQLWRKLLRFYAGADLEAACLELIAYAVYSIAASVDTESISDDPAWEGVIVFKSERGSLSYQTFSDDETPDMLAGAEIPSPVRGVFVKRHAGTLPHAGQLITTSTPQYKITAIKLPDDQTRAGIIVRGYNTSTDPLMVTLTVWRRYATAEVLNLDESTIGGKLMVTADGNVRLRAVPDRLLTLWFHD